MPDLLTSLQKHDLGHILILSELCGIELDANETETAAKEFSASLLDPNLLAEILEALSPEGQSAIDALQANSGRLPWVEFTRHYGDIRDMGTGKRDREKPYRNPTSPAEVLFYRGLLARAFFDTDSGPQEFAFIPDDLLTMITREDDLNYSTTPLGRPALPREKPKTSLATDRILDHATTLLATLRIGLNLSDSVTDFELEKGLLASANILKGDQPQPEQTKTFLEAPRDKALRMLTEAWLESEGFNELHMLPGLIFEGEWKNDPRATRQFLLILLDTIPKDKWWSLTAFIQGVKEKHPDFQRPAGDYDAWFIRSAEDDQYLRGFESWERVDGQLIRFFITDILFPLGMVDLAYTEERVQVSAFRVRSQPPESVQPKNAKLSISSQGLISIPRLFSRVARYQVARFCIWEETKWEDEYRYRVTPKSLQGAGRQGLKIEQLLSLLAKHSKEKIPPSLVKALKSWDANGIEARIGTRAILKVSKPEILEALRKSRAGRFLGEALGPTAVVVKDGAQPKVSEALTELGLLAEEEE